MNRSATIGGVRMSRVAAELVEWTGTDPAADLYRLQSGEVTAAELLADCLDGAEPEHVAGWRDYVACVAAIGTVSP